MEEVINVQFQEGAKSYSFAANGVLAKEGQKVVVEGVTGPEVATVVKANSMLDTSSFQSPLKKVLRKATEKDIASYEKNIKEAKQVKVQIKQKVKESGLQMKVVDVYYSLDRSRLTVEYTAEDRVDFREFIKDLANVYKTRIEMKQIGARDEVKQMGGIGPCGKECCCKECLKEFTHVSVKMAKTQNLSLSPTKICGLCGRLMCCLAYENPYYAETQSLMPKVNATISTPAGEGVVVSNDVLRRTTTVKFKQPDESFVQKTFTIKELRGEDPMVIEEGEESPNAETNANVQQSQETITNTENIVKKEEKTEKKVTETTKQQPKTQEKGIEANANKNVEQAKSKKHARKRFFRNKNKKEK